MWGGFVERAVVDRIPDLSPVQTFGPDHSKRAEYLRCPASVNWRVDRTCIRGGGKYRCYTPPGLLETDCFTFHDNIERDMLHIAVGFSLDKRSTNAAKAF